MNDEIRHRLQSGREHFENERFVEAKEIFTEILQTNHAFADVYNMLGFIYHDLSDLKQAAEHYERALEINPAYTEAALNLVLAYNELGQYEDAKRVHNNAMRAANTQPRQLDGYAKGKLADMHADLADAYHGIGLLDEALREYAEGLDLCPSFSDIRTRMANTLRDLGRVDEAIAEYQEVIKGKPNFLRARVQLGTTLYAKGDKDRARAEWQHVLRIDPGNKRARAYLKMLGG